ncbi:MAG: DinB family protein [Roseivirga sp.]|nr:DinB family protein [Roseivirga sp.]
MRRIQLLFMIGLSLVVTLQVKAQMTAEERSAAASYMLDTSTEVAKIVNQLSEEQLNFKPNAETWSVADCMKHIAISEDFIWQIMDGALKTDPDPSKRSEVQVTDEQVKMFLEDRGQKVKTFPNLEPQNNTGSAKEALKTFQASRKNHVSFVRKTQEDLRNRYYEFPFGKTDTYQVLLFLSAHTRRHMKQMKEVMVHADFPQ